MTADFSLTIFSHHNNYLSHIVPDIEKKVHEAAWDAYMCGYCFVRLAHFLAINKMGE